MKYLKLYEEVQLNLTELDKDRNGEKRGQVLVRKLEEDPVKLKINGSEKTIDAIEINGREVEPDEAIKSLTRNGKYDSNKAKKVFTKAPGFTKYNDVLVSGGGKFKLNQVYKDEDFGSVGPGVLTRKYEAIQCLFIAFKLRFPGQLMDKEQVIKFWESYINKDKEVFKKIGIYLDDKFILTREIIDSLSTNKDWLNTFLKIPELLMGFKNMFSINGRRKYSVFLESNKDEISPVYKIYKKFNELKKHLSSSINFSKFCPGDVYIVVDSKINEINTEIDKIKFDPSNRGKAMSDLVKLLDTYFDRNELIPVSLKKFKEGDEIIINKEATKKLPDFKILKFIITDDPLKGIGSKIKVEASWVNEVNVDDVVTTQPVERDIVFDSSDTGKSRNIDGDVSGSSSRHGKITLKSILSILNSNKNGQNIKEMYNLKMDLFSTLSSLSVRELRRIIIETNDDIKSLVPNQIIELNTKRKDGTSSKMYTDLLNNSDANIKNKLISKLQSLQLLQSLAIIQSESESDASIIMTSIMRYALSIQTYEFETPRYLRII